MELNAVYINEQAMVDEFIGCLYSAPTPWSVVRTAEQFDYRRGRTDVIAVLVDGSVVAFEAKLEKWREALHQAYRNTCFAHRSYVILPEKVAIAAARYTHDFARRNVGLCYVGDDDSVVVVQEAAA